MMRLVRHAWIVSILAEHNFDTEVACKVFIGHAAYQEAGDWAKQKIEYLLDSLSLSDPDNADIHSFRACRSMVEAEINL